jgi:hypothetical protein
VGNWLILVLASLVLGAAFTGATFFVVRHETVEFNCFTPSELYAHTPTNTYKKTSHGFPISYYSIRSAPASSGCQIQDHGGATYRNMAAPGYDSNGNLLASKEFSKVAFAKDFAIWTAGLVAVFVPLLIFRKKA